MKNLLRLFLIFLPIGAFIFIGQLRYPKDFVATIIFVTVATIIYFYANSNANVSEICEKSRIRGSKVFAKSFSHGLVLLSIFFMLCENTPIGGYIAQPLVIEHSQEKAPAIFVLAAGPTLAGEAGYSGFQRLTHGIELLQKGQAPHLFISTGYSKISGHRDAAWVASYTAMFNLDSASYTLLIDKSITTTATEAAYGYKQLSKMGIKKILLVTNGTHIYRSQKTFEKAGFEVLPAPTHDKETIVYEKETYMATFHSVMHEWIGLLYYYLTNRI